MNFQISLIFFTFLQVILAAPLPYYVTVTAPDTYVTTIIPVAEVIISDGQTTTIQLTTLVTQTSPAADPTTLATETNLPADPTTENTETTPETTVDSVTPATSETTSTPALTTSDCTSTSISVDSNGVAHVWVTLDKTVLVGTDGVPFDTQTEQLPQATETPVSTSSTQTSVDLVGNNNVAAATLSTDTTSSFTSATTGSTSPTTQSTPNTTNTSSEDSTSAISTTLATETTSSSSAQDSSSETSLSMNTDAAGKDKPFVTTWANGEVFYSSLPFSLVPSEEVAPNVALTTTTLTNINDAPTTTALLSLVLSSDKLLLPTLTVGLPKDKNVNTNMADPATVSVTNTKQVTTPVIVTTSSTSSTTPTADSTSSSSPDDVLQDEQTSTSAASSSASSDSGLLTKAPYSIVYSPYNNDNSCKSYTTVFTDLKLIASKGIKEIRIYGNDCNYLTTVLNVANKLGLKVNQGFWISQDGANSIDDAVDNFITYISSGAAEYSWDLFSYITVGNEAIISNYCSVDDLINKISEVKGKLNAAGYSGKITTSEPPVSFENNPQLCTDSEIDFVGINPHSYFDVYSSADNSGVFVAGQIEIVKQYCGDKDIVVTETGYPSAGNVNGDNVPSVENQRIAVQSILDVVGTDVTILSTYDDYWKQPGPYNIEQHFGIIQLLPSV